MPIKTSIAEGHTDLLKQLRRFVTGHGKRGTSTYVGTGDGVTSEVSVANALSTETWTITCIDANTVGSEVWLVVGSVSGLMENNAVTGVKYDEGPIEFLITAGAIDFIKTDVFTIVDNVYTGTGNGTIGLVEQGKDTVDETWTIKVTSIAGGAGSETWSVIGSVTGALADATTAIAYVTDHINFTITAGGVAFAVNDQFVYDVLQGDMSAINRAWVQDKWTGTQLYMHGVGLDGTKEIYMAIRRFEDVDFDQYGFAMIGATGHVGGNSFQTQPGTSVEKFLPSISRKFTYKLFVNGQRIILHSSPESVHLSFYIGFMFPYGTPSDIPYPLVVSASNATASSRNWDILESFYSPDQPILRDTDGNWISLTTWPYGSYEGISLDTSDRERDTMQRRLIRDSGGETPVIPIVLLQHIINWNSAIPDETGQQFGEFDGVVFVSGYNMGSENIITDDVSGKKYFVTRSSRKMGFHDYAAIEIE